MYNRQENFLFKKEVDWSVLHEGFSIPVAFQENLQAEIGGLARGESRDVYLHILDEVYKTKVKNQPFDETKYLGHPDVLQVRYSRNSTLAQKFRAVFSASFKTLTALRQTQGKNIHFKVPAESRECIVLYGGNKQGDFVCDCIQSKDIAVVRSFFNSQHVTEDEFESSDVYSLRDAGARIETKEQLVRIRRLDRSIGNCLKKLYNYRCQICADNFGKIRGTDTAESHHIDPFVSSFNNDSDNILVVCPNHHTVIHKSNPVFDRQTFSFFYQNGFRETLRLNEHLSEAI